MKSHITTEVEAKLDINMSLVLGAERAINLDGRVVVMVICDRTMKILWKPDDSFI
jgi:hypothetical protein